MMMSTEQAGSHAVRLAGTPAWRREPYRIFFPLGALLAWAGVLHWLLHSVGWLQNYESVVHSIVQIQGFMMCFAAGFLFTAVPRRTETAPPSAWQMVVALAAPVATTVTAWLEMLAVTQLFWFLLVVVLFQFAVSRFLDSGAGRRPPASFIWIPISLVIGMAGSIFSAAPAFGERFLQLHDLGRLLLLQGMFIGLVTGVGGLALPLITRGQGPPDTGNRRADAVKSLLHVGAAMLLVASCWIENSGWPRSGLALRGGLALVLLVAAAGIHRMPTVPGWNRRLIWLAGWMIPAGYFMAALYPGQARAGLHVVFIGGFALMAFAVGLHVTLAHGGRQDLVRGPSWMVAGFGACFLAAMVLRALLDFDPPRFFLWMGISSTAFLVGTLFWAFYLFKGLSGRPVSGAAPPA